MEDRSEEKFWACRQSLRLWPIMGTMRGDLEHFFINKLRMDRSFVESDLGSVDLKRNMDPRSKVKNEIIVEFECKEVRDDIKAQGPNLANFRDETASSKPLTEGL